MFTQIFAVYAPLLFLTIEETNIRSGIETWKNFNEIREILVNIFQISNFRLKSVPR